MNKNEQLIELDGSMGEGGGQILRSALTLSMVTGKPFRIERIRAGRKKPGLLRQHLTAVLAAQEICRAGIEGASAGSQLLEFYPGAIRGGEYRFAIGTAGSCTLVLQTVLPALWFADTASRVTVCGGTHNSMAPPANFLIRAWLLQMRKMGVTADIELLRHGFYPAGGGEIVATVTPSPHLQCIDIIERGELQSVRAEALVAGVPVAVAKRELEQIESQLTGIKTSFRELPSREGPGNVVMLEVTFAHVTEVFTGFGEKGVPAEKIAKNLAGESKRYINSSAAADEHLADQLILPMALAGGGAFTTRHASEHLRTNAKIIEQFLPVSISMAQQSEMGWRVHVTPS